MSLNSIVLRREVITSQGKRLELKRSGWQRCYMKLQGDFLRIWNAGGILLENTEALDDLENNVEPVDSIHLRLIHVQKISDKNSLCLHLTRGMERILLSPEASDEGRTIEKWASLFQRSVRDSVLLDQYHTSVFIHTYKCNDILSYVHKSTERLFDDSFTVEFKWPGMISFDRSSLTVKMKPGWKDYRVISKRCIYLSKEEGQINKIIASISPVTSFHLLSEKNGIIIVEGEGKYKFNDANVVPLADRIQLRLLQPDDLKRFLLFMRDSFEIILPRPTIFDESESAMGFQKISIQENEDKSLPEDLSALVQSQPWNQLAWNDLFAYYKLKNFRNYCISPYDFTLKLKSFGFCLKSAEGSVVNNKQLQSLSETCRDEEELKALFAPMYWHHLALKQIK